MMAEIKKEDFFSVFYDHNDLKANILWYMMTKVEILAEDSVKFDFDFYFNAFFSLIEKNPAAQKLIHDYFSPQALIGINRVEGKLQSILDIMLSLVSNSPSLYTSEQEKDETKNKQEKTILREVVKYYDFTVIQPFFKKEIPVLNERNSDAFEKVFTALSNMANIIRLTVNQSETLFETRSLDFSILMARINFLFIEVIAPELFPEEDPKKCLRFPFYPDPFLIEAFYFFQQGRSIPQALLVQHPLLFLLPKMYGSLDEEELNCLENYFRALIMEVITPTNRRSEASNLKLLQWPKLVELLQYFALLRYADYLDHSTEYVEQLRSDLNACSLMTDNPMPWADQVIEAFHEHCAILFSWCDDEIPSPPASFEQMQLLDQLQPLFNRPIPKQDDEDLFRQVKEFIDEVQKRFDQTKKADKTDSNDICLLIGDIIVHLKHISTRLFPDELPESCLRFQAELNQRLLLQQSQPHALIPGQYIARQHPLFSLLSLKYRLTDEMLDFLVDNLKEIIIPKARWITVASIFEVLRVLNLIDQIDKSDDLITQLFNDLSSCLPEEDPDKMKRTKALQNYFDSLNTRLAGLGADDNPDEPVAMQVVPTDDARIPHDARIQDDDDGGVEESKNSCDRGRRIG